MELTWQPSICAVRKPVPTGWAEPVGRMGFVLCLCADAFPKRRKLGGFQGDGCSKLRFCSPLRMNRTKQTQQPQHVPTTVNAIYLWFLVLL